MQGFFRARRPERGLEFYFKFNYDDSTMAIRSQTKEPRRKRLKAVGLLSGGLDSILAIKIMKDLGVEVHAVYLAMPWGCGDEDAARRAAQKIEVPFKVIQLEESYLELVRNPEHGYGRAKNPCVDCHIYMIRRAAAYMKEMEGDFVFTGEVLGQRPMSQLRWSMKKVEVGAGLDGRLLRPLSAQLLKPTLLEEEGRIDRKKLLGLSGRSRREQIRLAKELGIREYPNPAGGCLLTEPNFARRLEDFLSHGYRDFSETVSLRWGRHFRLSPNVKAILGRDEKENELLIQHAHPEDTILQLEDNRGPTCVLKGARPDENELALAGGLIQRFSRYTDSPPRDILFWRAGNRNVKRVRSRQVTEAFFKEISL